MILLDVVDIKKRFGPEPVLDGATFEVRPGDRIGLVGSNGSGKTTLLRLIAGREEPDAGSCTLHPSVHLGYLEQQPRFEAGRTLHDEARGAMADLVALQREAIDVASQMAETADPAEQRRLAARYDHLQLELQQQNAYNLEHRIERVLDGLRFRRESFDQPVASLSGGEQNRLMLAKLLLSEPNVMILDEPSNHLDIEATEWLEGFLLESSAAIVVVSHDRYFLDRVTNRTLELFDGTVDSYTGNFSAYWRQKADRLLVQQRTYDRQQIEIEKTEEFVRRNLYGQKHAQAEDRRKKLERLERVARPRRIAAPPMQFPPASRSGDLVVRARRVAKAFQEQRPLFQDITFDILRGQRWALLGPNGCGKTTLLRCLLGLLELDQGEALLGASVTVGYFDQQLAGLADDERVVDAVRPRGQPLKLNQQQRRDLLARFGLTGDVALQRVDRLSGGERCRAALARLAAEDANLLVLDEPTNHLDLWARDALETAIKQFDGTVLFVSHDRYFVNRVADHLLVIEPGQTRMIEGDYDRYQTLLGHGVATDPSDPSDADLDAGEDQTSRGHVKTSKKPKKTASKRRFPYRKVDDLEKEIFEREQCVEQLQRRLAEPQVVRDGDLSRDLYCQIEQEQAALQQLYEHWEEAAELNW